MALIPEKQTTTEKPCGRGKKLPNEGTFYTFREEEEYNSLG